MIENDIARDVVDICYRIHTSLGPGLLESAYEKILSYELRKAGYSVVTQVRLPVLWDGHEIKPAFRADIIIEEKVIVELKSVYALQPVHKKQLLTYLKITDKRLGLLVNFGGERIKDGINRIANNL